MKLAGDADDAVHQFHKLARDREAKAGTAIAAVYVVLRLGEAVENAVEMLGRNADAGVADPEFQHRSDKADRQGDGAPLGELDRIGKKVGQSLLKPAVVADDPAGHIHIDHQPQGQPLHPGLPAQHQPGVVDHAVKVERSLVDGQLGFLKLREVEHVRNQRQQLPGRRVDRGRHLALLSIQAGVHHHVAHADDGGQRRPQFVADGRQKPAFGAVGGFGLRLRFRQLADQADDIGRQHHQRRQQAIGDIGISRQTGVI